MSLINLSSALLEKADVYHIAMRAIRKKLDGNPLGIPPWEVTVADQVREVSIEGVHVRAVAYRESEEWRVTDILTIHHPHFVATLAEWASWAYDPSKPFPFRSYDDHSASGGSIWNEITGDAQTLALKGSLAHFISYFDLGGDEVAEMVKDAFERKEVGITDYHLSLLAIDARTTDFEQR